MQKIAGIILAAGKGKRMKSKLPKALHAICGQPMTRYVIDACRAGGVSECVVVIGHEAEQVREGLGSDVRYAEQKEQLGTGDACKQGIDLIADDRGDVIVLPGDTPLVSSDVLTQLISEHTTSGNDATVLTTVLPDAGHYGRVVRTGAGCVDCIVEAKDASPEQRRICEINAAIYCFKVGLLREYLSRITPQNAQKEYYLTDVIGLMAGDGLKIGAVVSEDSDIVLGINNRVDLAYLTGKVRERILNRLMLDGVTIIDPSSTYVDYDVIAGADTTIYPQTFLEKGTVIGERCSIGPSSRLVNVKLGNEITVVFSNMADSTVGDGTRIGPFANIRLGCRIGNKVKIGDFVEIKNAVIEDSVSMGHLAYIGDAQVGEKTNVGAGAITCNYDGYAKHKTVIGKNVFLGSNTTLVAPVEIGDGALVAAGSVITEDVPGDALAIGRSRQSVKEDWAKLRREKQDRGG